MSIDYVSGHCVSRLVKVIVFICYDFLHSFTHLVHVPVLHRHSPISVGSILHGHYACMLEKRTMKKDEEDSDGSDYAIQLYDRELAKEKYSIL